jgi:hypothetical protein
MKRGRGGDAAAAEGLPGAQARALVQELQHRHTVRRCVGERGGKRARGQRGRSPAARWLRLPDAV